ncbi:MAG: glycosyltransferase family 9 protein, partial [Candidatus Omnitrophota bacterium]
DLQNNRRSHILSALTFVLDRYGYDNKKLSFLLNHRIKDEKTGIDPVRHQFRILKMLGIDLKDPSLELWPSEEDRRYIDTLINAEWVSSNQRLIGINMSASLKWLSKNWPLRHIARLCEELGYKGIRLVLTGTEKDIARANELMAMVKNTRPLNACGKTSVNQLACLIKRCSVYITGDSAPLHIAVAVGVPFVALFGPTDPKRHLPEARDYVVIKKDLACSPCYKSKCKSAKCMELIRPEEVLEVINSLLK